jgi:hypothetical protein
MDIPVNRQIKLSGSITGAADVDWFGVTSTVNGVFTILLDSSDTGTILGIYSLNGQGNLVELTLDDKNAIALDGGRVYYIKVSYAGPWQRRILYSIAISGDQIGTLGSDSLSIEAEKDKIYYVAMKASAAQEIGEVSVTYDPAKLSLVNLAAQSEDIAVTAGLIPDTDLRIISHENGVIIFHCDKEIPNDMVWSGLVTLLEFKALGSGQTDLLLNSHPTQASGQSVSGRVMGS